MQLFGAKISLEATPLWSVFNVVQGWDEEESVAKDMQRTCFQPLFYMGVMIDVILAVAVVAIAPGAVAKLQLGIGDVGPAADGAFVGKADFWGGLLRTEGDRLTGGSGADLTVPPDSPGGRQQIQHILAEGQEIIHKRYQRQ